MQHDQKIGALINLIKLPLNNRFEFEFDQNTDWVRDILVEMNEKATDKTPEEWLKETNLAFFGEIEKKNRPEMGEFLLVTGHIEADYAAECVRTLRPMKLKMDVPFKICFVDESFANTELFADADETWVDSEVYELYFYQKRIINLQEMLHEQVFLNYEQYPIADADSKLEGVESQE